MRSTGSSSTSLSAGMASGVLGRKAGDEIPMALRIVTVAKDAAGRSSS